MLNNAIWTARNRRKVVSPRNVEKEEESLNVVSGNIMLFNNELGQF